MTLPQDTFEFYAETLKGRRLSAPEGWHDTPHCHRVRAVTPPARLPSFGRKSSPHITLYRAESRLTPAQGNGCFGLALKAFGRAPLVPPCAGCGPCRCEAQRPPAAFRWVPPAEPRRPPAPCFAVTDGPLTRGATSHLHAANPAPGAAVRASFSESFWLERFRRLTPLGFTDNANTPILYPDPTPLVGRKGVPPASPRTGTGSRLLAARPAAARPLWPGTEPAAPSGGRGSAPPPAATLTDDDGTGAEQPDLLLQRHPLGAAGRAALLPAGHRARAALPRAARMRRPQRGSGGVRERGSRGRRERAGMRMRMRLRRAPLRAARRTCAPAARSGRAPRGSTALAARNAADVSTCDPTQRAPAAAKQARANRVRFPRAGRAGNHWDASFPGTWELWRVSGKRRRTGIYTSLARWTSRFRRVLAGEVPCALRWNQKVKSQLGSPGSSAHNGLPVGPWCQVRTGVPRAAPQRCGKPSSAGREIPAWGRVREARRWEARGEARSCVGARGALSEGARLRWGDEGGGSFCGDTSLIFFWL